MQNNHAIHPNTRKSFNFSLKTGLKGQIAAITQYTQGNQTLFGNSRNGTLKSLPTMLPVLFALIRIRKFFGSISK
jgi:hypothetical protein